MIDQNQTPKTFLIFLKRDIDCVLSWKDSSELTHAVVRAKQMANKYMDEVYIIDLDMLPSFDHYNRNLSREEKLDACIGYVLPPRPAEWVVKTSRKLSL